MLFSYKMLKRIANLPNDTTVEQITCALNKIGFEVENTTYWGDVSGVKFGKVLKVYLNPNSNKLWVCEIVFDDKMRIIQTTAANMKVGMTIVAFVSGSKMGKMVIGTKKMANIVSEGMLSSLNELGANLKLLRDESLDNIQEYPKIDLHKNPVEELDLQDYIIDVNVLPNRFDANSYLIMARELSAYFVTNLQELKLNKPSFASNIKAQDGQSKHLSFLEIKNNFEITIQEQLLLIKGQIKSISNVVDLTNLTLIMTGQAVHAYDRHSVGNNFSSKFYTGEVTIFGNKKVKLQNNLIIENNNLPVSLAGVMGFAKIGISQNSYDIVLELGRFDIKDVRKSLKTIKLNSSAGVQNLKKLGQGTIELAYEYLFSKLKTFSKPINLPSKKLVEIPYDQEAINKMAGFQITSKTKYQNALKSLEKLGFKFLVTNKVIVPAYRYDISLQEDLNEEVFRFYGIDNFEAIAPLIISSKVHPVQNFKPRIMSQGYKEIATYTLISEEKNIINPFEFKKNIQLLTFVSKQRSVIRNSLAPSILEIAEYNIKRKIEEIAIFTQGMIANGTHATAIASNVKTFEAIKSDVINLLPKNIEFIRTTNKTLHPGVSANIILNQKIIGWIGKVHPSLVKVDIFIAEFITPNLNTTKTLKKYSSQPLKTRDITFEVGENEDLQKCVDKFQKFDVYSIRVIDKFFNLKNKITIRITANNKVIQEIDKKFN